MRGQNSTSGSPSPGEKGSLIVITSREDPRWRRRPLSWPTSLTLITSCNLPDRPAPLLLLSQPCNYVHLGHATVKYILLNQSFHLHCFISASRRMMTDSPAKVCGEWRHFFQEHEMQNSNTKMRYWAPPKGLKAECSNNFLFRGQQHTFCRDTYSMCGTKNMVN